MEQDQLVNWFSYHAPTSEQLIRYMKIREAALKFAIEINELLGESADKTAAMRKLRECVMTVNAGIACGGK